MSGFVKLARIVGSFAFVGLTISGCREESALAPDSISPKAIVGASGIEPSAETIEQQLAPRFALDLKITDAGPSLLVDARVKSVLATPSVRVILESPDLAIEERRKLGGTFTPKMRPLSEKRRSLVADEQDETRIMLVRPEPGYYRIYLTATAEDSPTTRDERGRPVQSMAAQISWLFVTATRIVVTSEFDSTLFGDTLLPAPGQLRQRPSRAKQRGVVSTASMASLPHAIGSTNTAIDRQRIRLVYWNLDLSPHQFSPVVGAYVNVRKYDDYSQTETWIGVLTTDANGEVSIPCSYDSPLVSYYWDARGENNDVVVTGGLSAGATTLGECTEQVQVVAVSNDATARVFSNFRSFVPLTRSLFAHSRAKVTVDIVSNSNISRYLPSNDRIQIAANGTNAAVWSAYGRFTQIHEYGHALHEKAFGGIFRPVNGSCPQTHYFGLYSNLGCAWVEGFASYVAWAVWTPVINDPIWAPGDFNPYRAPSQRGSIGEADVAALLYDLTDPSNESFDTVAISGSYLKDITRNCRSNGINPVDGIDVLLSCLERVNFDNSTWSTFFLPDRGFAPFSITPNTPDSGGTTPAQVRTLWRWNLFSL